MCVCVYMCVCVRVYAGGNLNRKRGALRLLVSTQRLLVENFKLLKISRNGERASKTAHRRQTCS